jgi:uncharacterized RDD family membrane protein YckC
MKRLMVRLVDGLVTLALGVAAAWALGALFIWLWAPTPTPENSSPPPEAFLFLWGAVIGFLAVLVGRLVLVPLWSRRRHHAG